MMSSLPRPSSLAWGIALLAMVFGGCSSGGGSSKALDPLESAQVVAGVGLGELRIGDPLRSVTRRFGVGAPAAIVTDDYWVELRYRGGQLVLLFPLRDGCLRSLQAAGRVVEQIGRIPDPDAFFSSHAPCGEAPLASLALTTDDPADPVFGGATDRGIRLGSDRDAVLAAYGPPGERAPGMLYAADSPGDDRLDAAFYPSGLALYLAPPDDAGPWQVRKILLFRPQAS